MVRYGKEEVNIVGNGFSWIQLFQEDLLYVLTVVVNEKRKVVQFYYDICIDNGYDVHRQSPWFVDAIVDVVVLPNMMVFILDEDELLEGVNAGKISKKKKALIHFTTNHLIQSILHNQEPLMKLFYSNSPFWREPFERSKGC